MRSALVGLVTLAAMQQPARADEFQRGVCYAHTWGRLGQNGYGSDTSAKSLERLKKLGVEWLSLTPFGYMPSSSAAEIVVPQVRMAESDERLAIEARRAHQLGMKVVLKPHIWIRDGEWQGDLKWADEAAFKRWFDSYFVAMRRWAMLAERERFDLLVIGTELKSATARSPAAFRALIAELRKAYHGPMTYAANWDEADRVAFWDALDYVGVQAYAPIARKPGANEAELREGWRTVSAGLEALAKRTQKRVLITEIGYRATRDAALAPATWPESDPSPRFDPAHQAACYRAALDALWGRPWLAGIYFWKWFTDSQDEQGPTDFSPAGKPAEAVLGEYYRREFLTSPRAQTPAAPAPSPPPPPPARR
jgi:Glycoside Hydrolase Family 113